MTLQDLWLNQVRASVSTAFFISNSLRIVHSIHSCKCIQFAHTSAFNSLIQVHSIHSCECIQFTLASKLDRKQEDALGSVGNGLSSPIGFPAGNCNNLPKQRLSAQKRCRKRGLSPNHL